MRCKSCRKQCEPFNSLNAFCDADCAISYLNGNTGKKLIEKVKRKKFREKKKEVKGLRHWQKVTQGVVNKYVRLRDRNLPCISCGKWDHELKEAVRKGKWDAGHFKTVGGHPEIRSFVFCVSYEDDKTGHGWSMDHRNNPRKFNQRDPTS